MVCLNWLSAIAVSAFHENRLPTSKTRKSYAAHVANHLGHVSVQTTEKYLGFKQRLHEAVSDAIGIEPGP
jgi:hypothetical protein